LALIICKRTYRKGAKFFAKCAKKYIRRVAFYLEQQLLKHTNFASFNNLEYALQLHKYYLTAKKAVRTKIIHCALSEKLSAFAV